MIAIALACRPEAADRRRGDDGAGRHHAGPDHGAAAGPAARLGMALIMISHDLGLAASFADEVLVMYAGRGVERAPTRKLFAHVRMPYTRALLDAIPAWRARRTRRWRRSRASRPTSSDEQVGCPFAPRCPDVTDKCREAGAAVRRAGARAPLGLLASLRRASATPAAGVQLSDAAARGLEPRPGVHRPRSRRRQERHRARRLGCVVHPARPARRSGSSARPALASRPWRARSSGAAAEVRAGAVARDRARRAARPAAAARPGGTCRWSSRTRSARLIRSGA